jgi:hypothetical protein
MFNQKADLGLPSFFYRYAQNLLVCLNFFTNVLVSLLYRQANQSIFFLRSNF